MRHSRSVHRRSTGFTLVEILFAAGVFALVSIALTHVLLHTSNAYFYETGKIFVNRDIRNFTTEMTENATYANFFMIFPSYRSINRQVEILRVPGDPDQGYTTDIVDNTVQDGQSGDCLALIYKDPADDRKIAKIVIYFRAPAQPDNPQSTGRVRRLEIPVTPSSTASVWQLIPEIKDPTAHPEVLELARGLADGKLFYNFFSRSIIVKGEILHRGNLLKQAANTYNFTISPRG